MKKTGDDEPASMTFSRERRSQLLSANPLKRLNGEIKRRANGVGTVPNEASVRRLVADVLAEQTDE